MVWLIWYDNDDWMYVLLDKLPTVAEYVQAIYQHTSAYGTNKQKYHIHQFSLRITDLWKAFGRDVSLVTIRGVKDKLDRAMNKYSTKVAKAKGSRRANMINGKRSPTFCSIFCKICGS